MTCDGRAYKNDSVICYSCEIYFHHECLSNYDEEGNYA